MNRAPTTGKSEERARHAVPVQRKKRIIRRLRGEEVLSAFDGVLEAAEELLEVFAALDEIDVGKC